MRKISTIFLQVVVAALGICVFIFLLLEPHLEGRNAHATLFEIYFKDSFLIFAYIASMPFFLALHQALTLLTRIRKGNALSPDSSKTLRIIKYCALSTVSFVVLGVSYLFIAQTGDDIAGGVAIGIFIIFNCAIAAAVAETLEGVLQDVLRARPKTDLNTLT